MSTSPVVKFYYDAASQLQSCLVVRAYHHVTEQDIREAVKGYAIVQELHAKAAKELSGRDLEILDQNFASISKHFGGNLEGPHVRSFPHPSTKLPSEEELGRKDVEAITKLEQMLAATIGKPEGAYAVREIGKVFSSMHPLTRRLAFQLLCKIHEIPYSSKEAIRYFVLNPRELLYNVSHDGKTMPLLNHLACAVEAAIPPAIEMPIINTLSEFFVELASRIHESPRAIKELKESASEFVFGFMHNFNELLREQANTDIYKATSKQLQKTAESCIKHQISKFGRVIENTPKGDLPKVLGSHLQTLLSGLSFVNVKLTKEQLALLTKHGMEIVAYLKENPNYIDTLKQTIGKYIAYCILHFGHVCPKKSYPLKTGALTYVEEQFSKLLSYFSCPHELFSAPREQRQLDTVRAYISNDLYKTAKDLYALANPTG